MLLPGTAFLELALHAGAQLGCGLVRELVLEAPLVLAHPPEGAAAQVQVQVVVGEPDDALPPARAVEVYARVQDAVADGERAPWVRHATGVLAPEEAGALDDVAGAELTGTWPPPGAVEIDVEGVYDALAGAGMEYGPAFQGLRGAWRRGEEVFAEVELSEEQRREAASYGVHPALFDAALHAVAAPDLAAPAPGAEGGALRLPFAWSGVSLRARGVSALRVQLTRRGDGVSVVLADEGGVVALVDSLTLRAAALEGLGGAGGRRDALFGVEWVAVEPGAGGAVDGGDEWDGSRVDCAGDGTAGVDGVLAVVGDMLAALQGWLAEDPATSRRLAVVTRGAVDVGGEGVEDLAGAGVWGMVRTAQVEHPGRIVLVDVGGREPSEEAVGARCGWASPRSRCAAASCSSRGWCGPARVPWTGGWRLGAVWPWMRSPAARPSRARAAVGGWVWPTVGGCWRACA